jgi:hypothetical protein
MKCKPNIHARTWTNWKLVWNTCTFNKFMTSNTAHKRTPSSYNTWSFFWVQIELGLISFVSYLLLEVGPTQISTEYAALSIACHVGLHVDFSFTNFYWAFRHSPPSVKWTWTISAFSTNRSSYIVMVMGL